MKNSMKLLLIATCVIVGFIFPIKTNAQFKFSEVAIPNSEPEDVAVDSQGNIYIVYYNAQTVVKYNSSMVELFSLRIPSPRGLVIDSNDDFYVGTYRSTQFKKYSKTDGSLLQIIGAGYGYNGIVQLNDISLDDSDNIYVSDRQADKVHVFDSTGTFLWKFGTAGTDVGEFTEPKEVIIDHTGSIYVADNSNLYISKFDSAGNYISRLYGYTVFMDVDEYDNLYVVVNHEIRVYDPNFNLIRTIGAYGTGLGQFSFAGGLAYQHDSLAIIDKGNQRLQFLDLNPKIFLSTDVDLTSGDLVNFGSTKIFSQGETIKFAIRNAGALHNLSLTENGGYYISISGVNVADFNVDELTIDPLLESGDTTSFLITFSPQSRGTKTATATIYSNDTGEPTYIIALQGKGERLDQTLAFDLPTKTFGDEPFDLSATASSGLDVIFIKSSNAPISIAGNTVTINKAGNTGIVAYQPGNDVYNPVQVVKILYIAKANQTIDFPTMEDISYLDTLVLQATASTGLPVSYSSSNENVAIIDDSLLIATGVGTTTITARQTGNNNYKAAPAFARTVTTLKATQSIHYYLPECADIEDVIILESFASSGLPLTYSVNENSIANIVDSTLQIIDFGTITISASQAGNENYQSAESVSKVLRVKKPEAALTLGATNSDTIYIDFGVIDINTKVEEELAIVNSGAGKLKLIKVNQAFVDLSSTAGFAVNEESLSEWIESGQQQSFKLIFEPTIEGEFKSQATVKHNDPDRGDLVVILRGVSSSISVGIEQNKVELKLYPNPTTDHFSIQTNSDDKYIVKVFSLQGVLLYQNNNYYSGEDINVNQYGSGTYLVGLHTTKKQISYSLLQVQ